MTKDLSPYVNVDVKMPKKVLRALSMHETFCVVSRIEAVDEASVREFLRQRFNDKIADSFKPEYLYSVKS